MNDTYSITNEGRQPFRFMQANGKFVTIPAKQTGSVELTDEHAFMFSRWKKFRFNLTEDQAIRLNMPKSDDLPPKPEENTKRDGDGKVVIPTDWETQPWQVRKSLAMALNEGFNVTNAKQAARIIKAELARRE